jgi:ABC-type Zn uptake system ZnuABC Zn-binding protein ZnuA
MGRGRVALVAAVVAALLAAGCSGSGGAAGDRDGERRLRVVATTTQVADLAANVGGDRVRVTGLLKPGIDPHDYEPSPADIDAIAHADLVLENGVGLEAWLGDTIDGSGFDGPVVDTSQGVRLRMVEGAPDPHIWQDPGNAERMAANIERGLAAAEPSAAGAFRANLAAYTKDLRALDAEVQRQVDSLANRKVVTDHDAFGYYLDRYGLELVGSVIPSFDTAAELSGADLRELVAKVKAAKVKAIFSEVELPPKTAETVGEEAGVKVITGEEALYGDGLGPAGSDGATYLDMMKHNTDTIVSALSGA